MLPKIYLSLFSDENQMKLIAKVQRRMRSATMMITMPMLPCTIAAILLMFASVAAFTYYPFPASAYSQIEPYSSSLYKNIASSSSSVQGPHHVITVEGVGTFPLDREHIHTVSFIADKPGSITYWCSIHVPNMVGQILVLPKPA